MPFWPFRKKSISSPSSDSDFSIEQLWNQIIEAFSNGDSQKVRVLCQKHKDLIRANIEKLRKAPVLLPASIESMDQYVSAMVGVAQVLSDEYDTPELMNAIAGSPENHPLRKHEIWCNEFADRLHQFEHVELIDEAKGLIDEVQQMQGSSPIQYLAYLAGRCGDAQFHSGQTTDALISYDQALQACKKVGDVEGEFIYLNQMAESYRYLGKYEQASDYLGRLIDRSAAVGASTDALKQRRELLLKGEPLCRVICVKDDVDEFEVDEVDVSDATNIKFFFRRNRPSLLIAEALTHQGNELASNGDFSDAIVKFAEAMEIDPFDPDPVYQTGVCLLDKGEFERAESTFEEVERLAPGWFHCRSDLWLAQQMADSHVSIAEFHILRGLEDGVMEETERAEVTQKAVEAYPEFAAFRLIYGEVLRKQDRADAALVQFQKARELAGDPDLESRALVAVLTSLPQDSPERERIFARLSEIDGNLIAAATAKLMAASSEIQSHGHSMHD